MTLFKSVLPLCAAFTLSACIIESPDDRVARLEQFNGKTVEQVATRIGPPALHEGKTAIWLFNEIRTYYEPIYEYHLGTRILVSRFPQSERYYCKYTVKLSKNRITSGTYEGNSCRKFAPRLPKKT